MCQCNCTLHIKWNLVFSFCFLLFVAPVSELMFDFLKSGHALFVHTKIADVPMPAVPFVMRWFVLFNVIAGAATKEVKVC